MIKFENNLYQKQHPFKIHNKLIFKIIIKSTTILIHMLILNITHLIRFNN